MDDRVYWIWVQQAFGEGSPMPWRIHRSYPGGLREFHEGGPKLWNTLGSVTEQQAAGLYAFSLKEAEARLEYAGKVGWRVSTPECEKYPEALRNIFDPPAVLYLKGKLPDVDHVPAVAIAGARKAREGSERAAEAFGYQLASGGAVVVSGGAIGVDAAALKGAIAAEGTAVSVLPVDLGSPYLIQNAALRRLVTEHGGALVSEYFSLRNPNRGTFPMRNRLITGLCCGTLLIQAAQKSGTIMYARLAAEQGRDVFVYPGPEDLRDLPEYAGSRGLLEDGAKAVRQGEEILEEYAVRFREKGTAVRLFPGSPGGPSLPREKTPVLADPSAAGPAGLSPEAEKVWMALEGEPLSVGQLEERTGLGAPELLGILTELELDGSVRSRPGKRYSRS